MSENAPSPEHYLESLIALAEQAASAVMAVYAQDFSVFNKEDKSPLTQADMAAHEIINQGLAALAETPVLSEEGDIPPWETRRHWPRYWLVDPLDGTKEFVNKNGEFTINIALIEQGVPVLGVVSLPAFNEIYFGVKGVGAWKQTASGDRQSITVNPPPRTGWKVVGSRSHNTAATMSFIDALPGAEYVLMGSSLKFCAVAQGRADIYPRFGPTSEWDTAAPQAVVEAAGGQVVKCNLEPLRYNTKASLVNPFFIACAEVSPAWSSLALQVFEAENSE